MEKSKKINWRFWRRAGEWILIVILAIVALVTAVSALEIPNGIRLYTVQSGSMTPTIPAGSIVLVKPAAQYREGDVITFKSAEERHLKHPTKTTTHRIDQVKKVDGRVEYVVKGDFNPSPDSVPVTPDLILGKVLFGIPLLGYPVAFAKTVPGLIILIIIPATLLIYSEIQNIKREVAKIKQERKKKKEV